MGIVLKFLHASENVLKGELSEQSWSQRELISPVGYF